MRMRTLPAATALAVLFSSVALVATPAYADTTRPIAVSDADDTVVDGVHQRLYFSDRYQNKIVVTDYTGTVVTTLTGLPQVRDLELSPDSGTLYAAVHGADKIVAFDTATLTQTAEYPTGDRTIPSRLALAGGKLWFGYGDQWDSGLGAVDLTAETPTVTLDLAAGHDWASPPMLYADPDNAGTLLALDGGISSAPIVVYDISSGTPVVRVSAEKGGFYNDAALTPDGQSVVVAGPGKRALTEYRLSDLEQVRTYPVPDEPETVSVAADGTVAATVLDVDDLGDTYVFSGGPDRPASIRNLSHNWMPWFGHSMSWSADGGKLFVLSGSNDSTRFHAVDEPRKYLGTLKVDAPATAARAKSLTVKGSLASALALPAGTPLNVTRTDIESPGGKSLGTKALGTGGTFSFTDVPPAGGKVKYTVSYAGDASHIAATASDTVDVSRATPTLTLNNNGKVYAHGTDVDFAAHLGTTYKNRTVEIWADPYGADKPKRLVKKGTVNANGNLWVTLDMSRDTTLTAVFAGDARYAPRSVKSTAYAKVRVSTALSKHYKTGKIGSTTYHYFHKNTDVISTTTMSYHTGRKQRLELQVYYDGRWVSGATEYFALGTNGKSVVNLGHSGRSGIRARVRSSYINGTSGDTVNSTTHGAWKYIYFSN
ncbi:Ig-like domain repeat protein [Streptomyces sp. PKU-EA00015]|uniref:YncE family protein n=1 Tax=Streptomyces sp. PKU-EA00015 TaxID=2748326 RepID=UPI00159FEDF9|nr:Ig-like domain repeat protein [Streptomyces sp. PKU-EA00015]NWF27865.1 Ig-like domain repeat protein [Streptomyces sp. PKU-EA00015]